MRITQTHMFILCAFFFVVKLSVVLAMISMSDATKSIDRIVRSRRHLWQIEVLEFTKVYITLKSILCKSIRGYEVSILLMVNNCLLAILTFVLKNVSDSYSLKLEIMFLLLCVVEVAINLLYLKSRKSDLIHHEFKKNGPDLKTDDLYKTRNIINLVSDVNFIVAAADLISYTLGIPRIELIHSTVAVVIALVAQVSVKLDISGRTGIDFRKYTLISAALNVLFHLHVILFAWLYKPTGLSRPQKLFITCRFMDMQVMCIVLFFSLLKEKKLYKQLATTRSLKNWPLVLSD